MRRVEDIDIFFFWRNLRKHFLTVLGIGLLCGVSAYLISFYLIKPTYKAESSMFAWGEDEVLAGETQTVPERVRNRAPKEMTYQDLAFGTHLVNDYREFIRSRYVQKIARQKINEILPDMVSIPYRYEPLVLEKTRFIKFSVYCESEKKAVVAADVISEVFIEAVRKFTKSNRVQIVDPAVSFGKVKPNSKRIATSAFFIGAGLIFVFFCLYDFFRYTLRNSEVVKQELGLPTIGTIGSCAGKENSNLICLANQEESYSYNHIVEDFQLLQTNLQYSLPQKNSAQILVLTSAFPKDGKSFTSLNLALTLCGNSKRVLLINCDLRKPEYDYLDLPRQPGLVNFLLGEKRIEEVINENVLGTSLSVIRSGPVPPNPARLLEIFQGSNVLSELSTQYDYIIIDSPPSMNMADPLLLSKLADGTIIVANSKNTPVDAVRQVVEHLRKFDVNILGVVLNRYSAQTVGYGYGYGYGEKAAPKG